MKRTSKGKINSRISIKLFIITAITFTTLLLGALFAQSLFYQRTYNVFKQRQIVMHYKNLTDELNMSEMKVADVAQILQTYKVKYNVEAVIFSNNGVTEKFEPTDLSIYQFSPLLNEGILFYLSNLSANFNRPHMYSEENFMAKDGKPYTAIAANILNGDEVLLLIGPYESYFAPDTPGLLDKYFSYITIISIIVSTALSYIFSQIISRPLLNINKAAKEMAKLNFNKKLQSTSNDELGQLSDSLNALSETLALTLKDLTAANSKLEVDIEKEREQEKIRKEFVANISHELKTPLTIIKGYGEALHDNVREDKKEHYINQIVQQTDNMGKLVEDMLELSRIEGGHYQPQITTFDFTMLTQNILESLRFLAEEKNLHFIIDFSSPTITLQADRMKIGQVITNFIHNAIRHTPQNYNIFVRIFDNNGIIRFEVENEGANIAEEKLNKVWGRFYREEEARNKKTGGTGLGLAISEKILQIHHMVYGVENTERGVTFYFQTDKDS